MAWFDNILKLFQPKSQPVIVRGPVGPVSRVAPVPANRGPYGPIALTQPVAYVPTTPQIVTTSPTTQPQGQVLGTTNAYSNPFTPVNVPAGPSDEEIAASYAPAFDVLRQQEEYLRSTELPTTLADIEKSRTKLQGELTEQEKATRAATERETGLLEQNKRSALEEVYRNYNILSQNIRNRFGYGGSAGMGATEIGQQEMYRQQGGISQSFGNQLGALLQKQTDLYLAINKSRQKINDDAEVQQKEASKQMQDRLNAIQAQVGLLEADRRQKRLAVLQDTMNWAKQINAQKLSAQLQIEAYRQQTEMALKADYDRLAAQQIDTSSNVFSPYTQNQYVLPPPKTSPVQSPIRTLARRKPEEDEFYFTNPFFATS